MSVDVLVQNGVELRCPFCGVRVVADPDELRFIHEAPTCEAFKRKMESFGLTPTELASASKVASR
jgi:hypothetical protein